MFLGAYDLTSCRTCDGLPHFRRSQLVVVNFEVLRRPYRRGATGSWSLQHPAQLFHLGKEQHP